MSTRATYQFRDQYNDFTVYKHHDGYPSSAYLHIQAALRRAWPLPRFEAAEFAAAFIAANKKHAGDIYLTTGKEAHADTEYHYLIEWEAARQEILVTCSRPRGGELEKGTLQELLAQQMARQIVSPESVETTAGS